MNRMQEHIAIVLEDQPLTIEEFAVSCTVSREWVVEHVRAGVLLGEPDADQNPDQSRWLFGGRDLMRARRMIQLERTFDANPELAGLVADLLEELESLRSRVRSPDRF